MKKVYYFFFIVLGFQQLSAQLYLEKQTRHRFAQLNVGFDIQTSVGGETFFINPQGQSQQLSLGSTTKPRILIGGTHFWGHADIYLAIPLTGPTFQSQEQDIVYSSGVETVFKYYPWKIQHNRIRPFIGISIAPFYYEQDNNNTRFSEGPELNHTSLPLYTGLTFNAKQHLFEVGLMYNYAHEVVYYLDRLSPAKIETPPFYLNFSYRYLIDTTIGAEKGWESGKTQAITDKLATKGALNNFFLAIGMSSAFWLGNSSYNEVNRPYLEKYSTSLMPDLGFGYYFHNPDVNIGASYRGYSSRTEAYGTEQIPKRRSFVFEVTKMLGDYHGFVPFIGPAISYERLSFQEAFEGNLTQDITEKKLSYGITFGWDIRPDRLQFFILRTNLRWFPSLYLDLENDQRISFNNLEFNFIQLILYPERIF